MRPIFTIHAGEYLVADYLERHFDTPKELRVWVPSKDNGIDLLVTSGDCRRSVSLQVKFSKNFGANEYCESTGWWNFNAEKLRNSPADWWILCLPRSVICKGSEDCHYIIVNPKELAARLRRLYGSTHTYKFYLWIKDRTAVATRKTRKKQQEKLLKHPFGDRDFSAKLNDWPSVLATLNS